MERSEERRGLLANVEVRPDGDLADGEDLVEEETTGRLENVVAYEARDALVLGTAGEEVSQCIAELR